MDMDDDNEDKIQIRRDSYLTTAIQELDNQMEDVKDNDEDNVMYDPIKSTKYKVIKLLIEKGAKLTIEREIPAIIQIIKQCNDDDIFEPERFQNKYVKNAGSEKNCIGYELIGLILQYAKNVDLNVVDNVKNAYAKSLLLYVIDLIKKECQSLHSALFNQVNEVNSNYSGRDKRIIEHKKKLYRDRVLKIPLISERILYKLLSYNECRMEINEEIIAEA
eukprot:111942_1